MFDVKIMVFSWLGLVGLLLGLPVDAEQSPSATGETIAVFYPKTAAPYQQLFEEVVEGMSQGLALQGSNSRLETHLLDEHFDAKGIEAALLNAGVNKVVALGDMGYQLAKSLADGFHVVSGALPISPNGVSAISLLSDPEVTFEYLELLAPEVKTVHVAYSAPNSWLIELAKLAAGKQGLKLEAQQVETTGEAVSYYNQLFASNVGKQDAIWVMLDRVASNDKVTLPIILEKAWLRDIVVFSSKPSHVKRGVLFSTYPDNIGLGRQLVMMLDKLAAPSDERQFEALKSLQLAVNLRTAAHLGYNYSTEDRKRFKLIFPE